MVGNNVIDLQSFKEEKAKKAEQFAQTNEVVADKELQKDVDMLIESLSNMIKIYEQQMGM